MTRLTLTRFRLPAICILMAVAMLTLATGTAQALTHQDSVLAQSKFSSSTMLFLEQVKTPEISRPHKAPGVASTAQAQGGMIAEPDTIDGRAYISAFVRLTPGQSLLGLEAHGVQVQCKFDGGLVTALIPVDSVVSVGAMANVRRVNVATRMTAMSHSARQFTGAGDVMSHSERAALAGLSKAYDGKGVALGIVDTGIDFQHAAFKDKDGKSRIKMAYVYDGNSAKTYTTITSAEPTTDDKSMDHGTHTASLAGGSSVIIDGDNVIVTDDHAGATWGGMAPGADLYLGAVNGLYDTYIANAFQKICEAADAAGEPLVLSNSWGSQSGSHDGYGDLTDVVNMYFGDNHPNHVCLFSASNDAGKTYNQPGGFYVSGPGSEEAPLGTIVRCHSSSTADDGYNYNGGYLLNCRISGHR